MSEGNRTWCEADSSSRRTFKANNNAPIEVIRGHNHFSDQPCYWFNSGAATMRVDKQKIAAFCRIYEGSPVYTVEATVTDFAEQMSGVSLLFCLKPTAIYGLIDYLGIDLIDEGEPA